MRYLKQTQNWLTFLCNLSIVNFYQFLNLKFFQLQEGVLFSDGIVSSLLCPKEVYFNRLALNGIIPNSLNTKDMLISNLYGETSIPWAKKRMTHKNGLYVVITQY